MPRRAGIDPRNIEVIDDQMAGVLRRLSGARRLEIASKMHASARTMIRSHITSQHPEWSDEQVIREVARRMLHGAF
jgi:hypothetical protein